MPAITLLNEADLRDCITLDHAAIDTVEQAFALLATAKVAMPPILRLDVPEHNGEVDVKTAYLPGIERFAIKVSPGFFDNPSLGLPSLNGMMMLLSARTGLLDALLLDNGYLTAVRTAAAGAVAARWLAREDSRCAALIGSGEQARLQLQALRLVRPIERVQLWARDAAKAAALGDELGRDGHLQVAVCDSVDQAMHGADIAITCTPSREPLIHPRHLKPGLHITAMGSDAEHKNEIAPQVVAQVERYVADRLGQTRLLGELHHALRAGVVKDESRFCELGQVIAGQQPGRLSAAQITLCDLTGTGAQDTAIANLAFERARAAGKGLAFNS
ncbi:ornithine cyclodeaminase [Pseudomonas guariconensis]|uniref:ectoine utilization protein EutC n=1 Tax=Pseudomonas TaxID=286 RepID=UPI00088B6A67|nr:MULTISPECIES: ectoine utilization protein EutC [Pseudomonas]MBH3358418.1 ectoine utilization protein EutC [Pseudomonas guariconensis]MCO7623736.1 ectoine utilization protein EutC [Pseudomonas guariconensis]MDM9594853.1 ectoine utilization protein EutC [Pseudomonas guariconensis]MDM9607684.1 ectoine utilization protein EutC [Pseudomonas guariconensis]MDM9612641.1 ectoine utilization protein EutC [Pseudomonas guariconensis]